MYFQAYPFSFNQSQNVRKSISFGIAKTFFLTEQLKCHFVDLSNLLLLLAF